MNSEHISDDERLYVQHLCQCSACERWMSGSVPVTRDTTDEISDAEIEIAAATLWQSMFDHPEIDPDTFSWDDVTEKERIILSKTAKEMLEAARKARAK